MPVGENLHKDGADTSRKSVLVTGGTVRLGAAISEHLASLGWRVVTTSHRKDAGADIVADFADPSGAVKCYSAALEMLGGMPPDALVNNAALFIGEAAMIEAVNLEAPKKLTMLFAGREAPGRGAVVNILDSRVLHWQSDDVSIDPYEASKRGLLEYTRKSAAMFSETIRVNAVAPGPVFAPIGVHEAAGETLLGRPTAIDVAKAVAFLLDAESTTGCIVPVDGGQGLLRGFSEM